MSFFLLGVECGAWVNLVRTCAACRPLPPCLWASSVRPPGETGSCGSLSWFPFYLVMVGVVIGEGVVLIHTLGALGAFLRAPVLLRGFLPHPPPGGVPALPSPALGSHQCPWARSWCPLLCMARFSAPFEGQVCQLAPPLAPPWQVQEGGSFLWNPLMSMSSCGGSWRIPVPWCQSPPSLHVLRLACIWFWAIC